MPQEINLTVELPDGRAQTTRHCPKEVTMLPHLAPEAYRAWLAEELPDAVAQLFERAGVPDPLMPLYDKLPVGAPHALETLAAMLGDFDAARTALHGVAAAWGIDVNAQRVDSRTGMMTEVHQMPKMAAEHSEGLRKVCAAAAVRASVLASIAEQLSASAVKDSDLPELLKTTLRQLAEQADERGAIIDRAKEALGFGADSGRDGIADADLPRLIENVTKMPAGQILNRIAVTLGLPFDLEPATLGERITDVWMKELHKREEHGASAAIGNLLHAFDLPTDGDDPANTLVNLFTDERARATAFESQLSAVHAELAQVRAERDASRRILRDVARNLGRENAGDTDLPGVASVTAGLAGKTGDWARVANAVCEVLDELTGEQRSDDAEELPEAVARAILLERYPVGTAVMLRAGDREVRATVHAITLDSENPIEVFDQLGIRRTVAPSDILGYPDSPKDNPGEFATGDGQRAKAFHLPEGGLKSILPDMPDAEKTLAAADAVLDDLGERFARFGDRVGAALDGAMVKLDGLFERTAEKLTAQDGDKGEK